jgi:hypothetical protein
MDAKPTHKITTPTIIFYGRLVYLDVVKRRRYSGFVYRWYRDDRLGPQHDRLGYDYPKYVKWN